MHIPELLAPAGNEIALHAAITAGADAVYLGLDAFNARRNADNFTVETLADACEYAHLRGCNVYVTMNTIVLPAELDQATEYARQAYRAGADGLIVQDIGLAASVAQNVGLLPLHISTQMNIHSEYGLEACAALGAKRVTLARELTLEEVESLCCRAQDLGLEVEVFAHGALCVCYSGQCFMSSMIGGRSANRGLCAQACRLPYTLLDPRNPDKPFKSEGEFLLSPKDLCSADMLGQLAQAGVSSLKIEGRMKSPEYVASAVSVYRSVLDRLAEEGSAKASAEERAGLSAVFSRGFIEGYLAQERGNEMMGYQRPNNRGQFIGRVKTVKDGRLHLSTEHPLEAGDVIEFWTRKGNVTYRVPAGMECGRKTAYIPADGPLGSVRQNDRAFRVRSASAEFKDNPFAPRIPVVGFVEALRGKPLRVGFHIAAEDEVERCRTRLQDPSISAAIARRLAGSAPTYEYSEAQGALVEDARSKAITADDVLQHIDRMGQTPFELCHLDIRLDNGVGMGFSQLHHCRAEALEGLEGAISVLRSVRVLERGAAVSDACASRPDVQLRIGAIATNPDCARAAKRSGADEIYVPAINYRRGQTETAGVVDNQARQAGFPKQCVLIMPVADHSCSTASEASGCCMPGEGRVGANVWEYVHGDSRVVAESLGAIQHALDEGAAFSIGQHLPVTNASSLKVAHALGAQDVWLSPELNLAQIADLAKCSPVPFAMKVHGAQELMVTEHCMLMSQGPCNQDCMDCARRRRPHVLRDRKDYEFPVVTDCFGRSHIYNSVELDIVSNLPDLIAAGVTEFIVDTTLMDAEQAAQATGRLAKALRMARTDGGALPKLPHTTSGHLHRGVS